MTNHMEVEWSAELELPVEIRHVPVWDEWDIFVDSEFMVTVTSLYRADQWLARYAMVKDEVGA